MIHCPHVLSWQWNSMRENFIMDTWYIRIKWFTTLRLYGVAWESLFYISMSRLREYHLALIPKRRVAVAVHIIKIISSLQSKTTLGPAGYIWKFDISHLILSFVNRELRTVIHYCAHKRSYVTARFINSSPSKMMPFSGFGYFRIFWPKSIIKLKTILNRPCGWGGQIFGTFEYVCLLWSSKLLRPHQEKYKTM